MAEGPIEPGGDAFEMWTIYDHPSDAPEFFVARKWLITGGAAIATGETMSEEDIDTLRKYFQIGGMTCLPRQPGDDPVIVESWL